MAIRNPCALIDHHQEGGGLLGLTGFGSGIAKTGLKQILNGLEVATCEVAEALIDGRQFDHRIDQHAAKMQVWVRGLTKIALKIAAQSRHGRLTIPRPLQDGLIPRSKDVQTFDEQPTLVAKGAIEAAAAQTHSLKQIAQRRGLITSLPKEMNGLLNSLIAVKFNGSRHGIIMDPPFQKDQETWRSRRTKYGRN